ncbi:MAG TPA: SMEK domain-containing protein, partial [Niabella sp.]
MKRIDYINKINTSAARFVVEVEGFNATGQYHINMHAENFLIPVLNEVFNLQLENLNATQKKNFPAIDLADFQSKVAFQITATADFAKIKSTLELFFEHKLDKHFDTLYIYIITHKKERYSEQRIQELLTNGFSFTAAQHVIDKDDLLQKINEISATPKLEHLAKLYEHEFSDVQIEVRKLGFETGYLNSSPETIYPNLLPIAFPGELYIAELSIDKEAVLQSVNNYLTSMGKKNIKSMKPGKLVAKALRQYDNCRVKDWILHENALYTFRDLNNPNERLNKIIDKGTITRISSKDFYETNEDKMRVFKHLLHNTFTEFARTRGIEWFASSSVYRFANNPAAPNQKQIRWKGKNEATKTVIFEMTNKKE